MLDTLFLFFLKVEGILDLHLRIHDLLLPSVVLVVTRGYDWRVGVLDEAVSYALLPSSRLNNTAVIGYQKKGLRSQRILVKVS